MNVAVVDLGLGNLGSVLQALRRAGGQPELVTDPGTVSQAPRVVLPGVAAFGLGMDRAAKFKPALQEALSRRAPVLAICLGMQILFEEGEEDGLRPGLGLLPGRVECGLVVRGAGEALQLRISQRSPGTTYTQILRLGQFRTSLQKRNVPWR